MPRNTQDEAGDMSQSSELFLDDVVGAVFGDHW